MLALSRKTDYALVALAELASHRPEGLSAHRLAEATRAPEAMLRNVLKNMCRNGLLASERGPFGGYQLCREPFEVAVLDVIEAIEGPVSMTRCCSSHSQPQSEACHHTEQCRIRDAIRVMHDEVTDVLRRTTLADLLSQPPSPRQHAVSIRVGETTPPDNLSVRGEAIDASSHRTPQ